MLLLKNLQFLPDHYETLTKEGSHEDLILTKFRNDPVKIVDFFVKAYFWPSPETPGTQCKPSEIDLYIHWLAPADVQNDLYLALEMEAI